MKGIRPLIASLILIGLVIMACEKSSMNPEETFHIRATIDISTLDMNSQPLSVPVNIKIVKDISQKISEAIPEVVTQQTDAQGTLTFIYNFSFQSGDRAEIIVDVDTKYYQSIQYWTAYLTANDAPGRQFLLQMDVSEK